ncbi:MAG: ribonuclease Z [Desulfurococcaceae archaeon]
MVNARIYFLGTGSAMPISRSLPCIALKVNSDIYLFDPAEGCQGRMFKHGLSPLKVKSIFITHAHGDHYLGLPGLMQSMTLAARSEPLNINGPRQVIEMLESMIKAGLMRPLFKINYNIVIESYTYTDQKIFVRAFPVDHNIETYGYHITIGKKTICYTGDTAPSQSTIKNCQGVDILIHDATFTTIYENEAREQKHSTAADAGKIASSANVKTLVLFHISARHREEEIYYDAYRFFKNIVVASDGLVIYL